MRRIVLALLGASLAGCSATGTLTPAATSDVTAVLAQVCPVAATVQAAGTATTKDSKAALAVVLGVCPPNLPPTNAVSVTIAVLNAYAVIKPLVK